MDIVKYHNSFNKLRLGNLTENETDIFFSLLMKARDREDNLVKLDFLDLKKLADLDRNNNKLVANILGLNIKLKSMSQTMEVEKGVYVTFSLFGDILTDTNNKFVEVPINPRFKYIINDLVGNFTMFDLKDLVNLKGNHSKVLFRLLKQWQSTREVMITMVEFRELMGISEAYEQFNINQRILKPCIDQLQQHFKGLKVEKLKRGVKIDRLKFTWKSEEKATKRDVSNVIRSGLTVVDYNNLYPAVEEIEEIKSELTVEEEKVKELKKKAERQGKSKLGNRYFEFFPRLIPLKNEKEIEKLCREFDFFLNEELF